MTQQSASPPAPGVVSTSPVQGAARRPRILVTLADTAWPLDGGKRLRCSGVLRGLASVGDVDLAVLFSTAPVGPSPVTPGVQVRQWVRTSPEPRGRVGSVLGLARGLPVRIGAQRWDEVRASLSEWSERDYDLVWYGGLDHARGLRGAFSARRSVVDFDDLETSAWRAYLDAGAGSRPERLQRRVELPMWRRLQDEVAGWADAVVLCSDLDAERFGADNAVVVPNTYPEPVPGRVTAGRDDDEPRVLVVANWMTDANVDSARFAVAEVLPRLHRLLPSARLRLVGRGAEAIADLAGVPGVDVVGPVEDVGDELAAAHVALVPTRYGGGTRLKIIEAFAHGVPVVTTSLGTEGLGVEDGTHALVRDDPDGLAAAVHALVADTDLRRALVDGGASLYREQFRPQAAVDAVAALVGRLLAQPAGGVAGAVA